jgi:hypothetical protein
MLANGSSFVAGLLFVIVVVVIIMWLLGRRNVR